jgi:CRP-like cAMP-binding protein
MFRGREELYREIHYVLQKAGISPAAATHEWRVRKSEIPVAEPPTIQLALKSQEIFTHLADDEIEEIACESQQIHYEAGAKIQYDTGEVDAFDIVISGVVEVSMELPSGKRISAGELKPGDSYGLVSMFTDNPQSSDWIAQTDVTLIRIDLASMKRLLKKHPHLTDRIASVVKQRQDEAESLRMQDVAEGGMSSLREIKTYIKQMLKRTKK